MGEPYKIVRVKGLSIFDEASEMPKESLDPSFKRIVIGSPYPTNNFFYKEEQHSNTQTER